MASFRPSLRAVGPGKPIRTPWSWFAQAPPKDGDRHWREGRSALELARAWCRGTSPCQPRERVETLEKHPLTLGFEAWDVVPELVTPLPFPGEGRNHDIAAIGVVDVVPTFVGVEAKAGERFGDKTVGDCWRNKVGSKSKVPHRVAAMLDLLTGDQPDPGDPGALDPAIGDRGYQLLTASAGTVLEARRRHCQRAVLLIHEFRPKVPSQKLATELSDAQDDLDNFVDWLSAGKYTELPKNTVVVPRDLPTPHEHVVLLVGKCVTELG